MFLVPIFIIWKSIDIIVSLLSPIYIPYLGFFSYGPEMLKYRVPDFIRALTNFDGIFYIRIAMGGYSYTEQAYFPIYPAAIKIVTGLVGNPILAGVTISHAAFLAAVYVFYLYLRCEYKNPNTPYWIISMMLVYPTSYYFGVMYTESIFFFLLISALYFQKKNMLILAFIFSYLTALTRVVGVFLFIPLAFQAYQNYSGNKIRPSKISFYPIMGPLFGLSTYMVYLWKTMGDPLFFFHAQESFGAQRSTHLISPPHVVYRYIKIFATAQYNFQYVVAILELVFYLFSLFILSRQLFLILNSAKKNYSLLGINLFSFINILLPSLTGTLTAMPRYTLLSFGLFFALGEVKGIRSKILLMCLFIALHIIMFAYFIQGYYIT